MSEMEFKPKKVRSNAIAGAQKKYYEAHKTQIFDQVNEWKRNKWATDAEYRKLRIDQISIRNKIRANEYKDAIYHIRFLFRNYRATY